MKLQKQSIRKIDLSQINKTNNIRKQYDDIESLARSIERDGQLQPIGVVEQENGTFNMLYGFRRLNAFLFLCDEGKDFNQIEAKITTGDPAIIQLIENIHRDDLKPEEFEDALKTLFDSGLSQKEIAERLNIRQTRVSDTLAAKKTRDSLKGKDIDTSELSTTAVSLLRSVPEEKQKEVVGEIKEKGSTVKAVKETLGKEKYEQQVGRAGRVPPETTSIIDIISSDETSNIGIEIPPHDSNITIEGARELTKRLSEEFTNKITEPDPEDLPWTQISIHDFLRLPEIKSIIAIKKLIIQTKCEKCGKEI
jgi:ParB/RepB/Spo0J family partition protein